MSERSKPRVLIVDDMKSARAMQKALLNALGCEVVAEGENGAEGVELFKAERPDLTLMDIEMPVKRGVEALKEILAEDPEAKVVMLTAVTDIMVVEECIFVGAKDYIRKDLDPATLKKRLEDEIRKL